MQKMKENLHVFYRLDVGNLVGTQFLLIDLRDFETDQTENLHFVETTEIVKEIVAGLLNQNLHCGKKEF